MTQTKERSIKKAGAIILNSPRFDQVVLLYRSKQNDWSFPKGHIDGAERPIDTMEREIKEETGLIGKVITSLPNLEYKNTKGEDVVVFMYLLVAQEQNTFQPEHSGDAVRWIDKNSVANTLTHTNLKEYFIHNLSRIEDLLRDFSLKH